MVAHAKSFDPTYMIDPDARALSALTEEERKQVLSVKLTFAPYFVYRA